MEGKSSTHSRTSAARAARAVVLAVGTAGNAPFELGKIPVEFPPVLDRRALERLQLSEQELTLGL